MSVRAVLAFGLLLWAGAAQAQTMRPFSTFRQLHGEPRLNARVEYGAGSLRVEPGQPGELYRMNLSYDEDRFVPVSDFDPSSRTAVLGLRSAGEGGVRVVSGNQLRQLATIDITPAGARDHAGRGGVELLAPHVDDERRRGIFELAGEFRDGDRSDHDEPPR